MKEKNIVKWQAQVKKGILDFILLLLLRDTDKYGYELIELIQSKVGYEIAEGTIYPLLIRLKDEGYVTSYWQEEEKGMPRKYYTLTKEGKQILMEMKIYWTDLSTNIQKLIIH